MTTGLLRVVPSLVLCCLAIAASPTASRAQTVAVMVNGEPITAFDIDQRARLDKLSHKESTRQQVIEELIDEKVKIKEAKKYGVDPSSSDVDQSFNSMASRMRMNNEQMTKMLGAQGIRADTLKAKIKADMVWTSLVRGRFKDSLLVGEKDVQAQLAANGGDDAKAADSFEYRMRPVVLISSRGSGEALDARRKEAEALRGRVQTCEEADRLFSSMPNAAIRPTVVKTSADLPPPLRDMLDKTPVGHLTAPEVTKQGIEMVALCAREPTTADTPKKREIREKMFAQKYEAKSTAYLQEIRKAAMIEYREK